MGFPRMLLRKQWLLQPGMKLRWTRCLYTRPQASKQVPPSPSELLRFVLRDSTEPGLNASPIDALPSDLREAFNTEWKSNSPPPSLWNSLKGLPLLPGKEEIIDVRSLRSAIARYANDKYGAEFLQETICSFLSHTLQSHGQGGKSAELLQVLDDLHARLHRLQLPVNRNLHSLCIGLAMRDLSVPAIRKFLVDYQRKGFPSVDNQREIMLISVSCAQQLDSKTFDDPSYDHDPMLAVVTGEGDISPQNSVKLRDILQWTPASEESMGYLYLLIKLGSNEVLRACWAQFVKDISSSGSGHAQAYRAVLLLVQIGRSETAAQFLEEVSQVSGDNLPHIAQVGAGALQALIDDPTVGDALPDLVRGKDYLELLEDCLQNIDRRLGIQWNSESQSHFSTAPESSDTIWEAFDEQALPTLDRQCIAADHINQLYAELQVNGCSKSPAVLGGIVDLLHDHDGMSQEIITHHGYGELYSGETRSESEFLELRWTPEYSPVEFSNSRIPALHDSSVPWTPSRLGLVRARLIVDGVPETGINALHLMQLGCMDMRYGVDQPWQSSGYIVVWDRHHNDLLALYIGNRNGNGVIDCGPAPSDGLFGALVNLKLPTDPIRTNFCSLGTPKLARNCHGPYFLDVDPSPDLH
ncbi:uncharacterized protein N7511_001043 [Penicillium nucicola]|uniref:uncharacterized protein n=1 Tax=Penicillium nucicola TaxID=1850975 RepID=UPI00254503F2|nr:uncharacterized protein N7511_001043 [Penicillium nucicola]KAJ5776032.1 hypothetical protein N7511_001043 [Penicillium nucicola]